MRTSEWFSTVDDDGVFVYFLIGVSPHIPAEHEDTKMAELIGRLDPFVSATEANEDVLAGQVQWTLNLYDRIERKKVG
jgi:hypothetical protein